MAEIENKKQETYHQLDLPKISWQSDLWLALIPFALTLLPFFFPDISNLELYKRYRTLIGVLILLSPIYIPIILWRIRVLKVVFQRASQYPAVFDELTDATQALQEVKQNMYGFLEKISNQKTFQISSASYQNHLYIIIPKHKHARLNVGNTVVVVHTEDGMMMGIFEIVEIRNNDYIAKGKSGVDPIWSGYVKQQGRLDVLPYFAAVYIPQGGENDQ